MTRVGETPGGVEPNLLQASQGLARPSTPGKRPAAGTDFLLLPEDLERKAITGAKIQGNEKQQEPEGQKQLEMELQRIGQKMRDYYDKQQELKSCQRRERILCKWLEMSPEAEGQTEQQQVREALRQIKVQMDSLGKVLAGEHRLMRRYVARVQDIRSLLGR